MKQDLSKLKEQKAEKDLEIQRQKEALERRERQDREKKYENARKSLSRVASEAQQERERRENAYREKNPEEAAKKPAAQKSTSRPPTKEQIMKQRANHKQLMDKLQQQNSDIMLKEEEARVKESEMMVKIKKKT